MGVWECRGVAYGSVEVWGCGVWECRGVGCWLWGVRMWGCEV